MHCLCDSNCRQTVSPGSGPTALIERRNIIEDGDVDEALNAASAIGDDTLQKQSGRGVVPESFTHGTSAQRQQWFRTGLKSGDPDACNTFD